ncbi:diguanylate cyclase/phosphodiesterase (GGDEF & EAL domains) with PAS/PAC sensor(s) [methanotrophic endosymbiont of Bathymodiolus azoricus (Menez Gwen)]|nr:diguanylate cyclase/phosphodiesterase (GGDEF & EAL domains) with PAS/PAC sensor(s) [methanotrophic endosymbiont of Bathymodiolus azoricus (Menez Gwen)]
MTINGMVNRREFEVRLARVVDSAKRERDSHALCFLDLDQFKELMILVVMWQVMSYCGKWVV